MSEHKVEVVVVKNIRPHDNADRLEIVTVWGYECVVRKGQFQEGQLAAFIQPDYVVPTDRPEFSFLARENKTEKRITMSRLRGVASYGLLIEAPEGFNEGDCVMSHFGITRYEPQIPMKSLKQAAGQQLSPKLAPPVPAPTYGLENYKRYPRLVSSADEVVYTAKIHGSSARYVYINGKMYGGSRTTWRKPPTGFYPTPWYTSLWEKVRTTFGGRPTPPVPGNWWWTALEQNPWVEEWCRAHPGHVVYGEIYGPNIQGAKFPYGLEDGQIGFKVFDVMVDGEWVDSALLHYHAKYESLEKVPVLYVGNHNIELLEKLAEEDEWCGHLREGVVVKDMYERRVGPRVALKYVSNRYYEMK